MRVLRNFLLLVKLFVASFTAIFSIKEIIAYTNSEELYFYSDKVDISYLYIGLILISIYLGVFFIRFELEKNKKREK